MKSLIIISAYCNTLEKTEKLRRLTMDLERCRDSFDVMIVSHTTVPEDIAQRVDYCFYDKKNELLYDWDLRNMPWFSPTDDRKILSIFTAKYNTHLAIWRMLILGNGLAENLGYEKVHHIEYDSRVKNPDVLVHDSKMLDLVCSIMYSINGDDIILGSYQAYRLNSIHRRLIDLDEEWIKQEIRKSPEKSPERMLYRLMSNGLPHQVLNRDVVERDGNRFGTSQDQSDLAWCLPFYDRADDHLKFIIWNRELRQGVDLTLVYNRNKTICARIERAHWNIIDLGPYSEAMNLFVITDDRVRDRFDFERDREAFKAVSYRE